MAELRTSYLCVSVLGRQVPYSISTRHEYTCGYVYIANNDYHELSIKMIRCITIHLITFNLTGIR